MQFKLFQCGENQWQNLIKLMLILGISLILIIVSIGIQQEGKGHVSELYIGGKFLQKWRPAANNDAIETSSHYQIAWRGHQLCSNWWERQARCKQFYQETWKLKLGWILYNARTDERNGKTTAENFQRKFSTAAFQLI